MIRCMKPKPGRILTECIATGFEALEKAKS